jgi:hypothetical protein
MDATGMGRISPQEFALLYTCCITFVKLLPFCSIGWRRVLADPRKFLLQTTFYAQGVVLGGLVFIALMTHSRQVSGEGGIPAMAQDNFHNWSLASHTPGSAGTCRRSNQNCNTVAWLANQFICTRTG